MQNHKGISRIEVIVTAVVLIVLTGILLPWLYNMRGQSKRSFCEARMIVISKALFLKAVDSPALPGYREIQASSSNGELIETSWVFPTLPYIHPRGSELAEEIEKSSIKQLMESDNIEQFRNGEFARQVKRYALGDLQEKKFEVYIPDLVCPDSGRIPKPNIGQPLSYIANCGQPDAGPGLMPRDHLANGVFMDRIDGKQIMELEFLFEHDGIENTFMLSENLDAGQCFESAESKIGFVWIDSFKDSEPQLDTNRLLAINQRSTDPFSDKFARPSSNHVGGVNVSFCDGATKFINDDIDYVAYVHFLTSDGFEPKQPGTDQWVAPPYRLELDNNLEHPQNAAGDDAKTGEKAKPDQDPVSTEEKAPSSEK